MATASKTKTPQMQSGMVGPVFSWEMVRHTRKGRGYFSRTLYASLSLAVLIGVFGFGSVLSTKSLAYLAEQVTTSYLTLQYLAVFLLTPVLVASALIEERQKRTLDLLLTTFLTSKEIIMGTLLSRLFHVMAVLLAGVPVLAFLQLLGGVHIQTILIHTALALLLMLACGMHALRAGMHSNNVGQALLVTYGLLIALGIMFGILSAGILPVVLPYLLGNPILGFVELALLIFIIPNFVVGCFELLIAVRDLRSSPENAEQQSMPVYPGDNPTSTKEASEQSLDSAVNSKLTAPMLPEYNTTPFRWRAIPPVDERPLVWKEKHFPPKSLAVLILYVFATMATFLIVLPLLSALLSGSSLPTEIIQAAALVIFHWYFLLLILVSLRTASSITDEFQQRTWDSLLVVPLKPVEIITQKAAGAMLRYQGLFLLSLPVLVILFSFCPGFTLAFLSLFAVQVVLYAMLGMLIAILARTSLSSRLLVAMFFFAAYFLFPYLEQPDFPGFDLVFTAFAPYSTWEGLCSFDYLLRRVFRYQTLDIFGQRPEIAWMLTCGWLVFLSGALFWICSRKVQLLSNRSP